MNIPGFTAHVLIRHESRVTGGAVLPQAAVDSVILQVPITTPFCGKCTSRTSGGSIGPYHPGQQNCLAVDTHGSWSPLNWSLSIVAQDCLGATNEPYGIY